VIISDKWVAPPGPDWDSFSIRWPEGTTEGLIETIERHDEHWHGMSAAATDAYREFFAPDCRFHHIVNACRSLLNSHVTHSLPRQGVRNRAFYHSGFSSVGRRWALPLRRVVRRAANALLSK
jgi:hypothetical protein